VFVDTQPAAQGGQPKQNRDGSYKYVLQVQLRIAWMDQFQQFTYPEQDARLFLRSGLRDEMTRAMHEAGDEGVPKEGALIIVTLTGRKPGNSIATNVFAVEYHRPGTWEQHFPQYTHLLQQQAPQQQMQQAPQQYGGAPQQAPYQQPQSAPAPQGVPGYGQAAPNPQQYAQAAPLPQGQAVQQYGQQAYDPSTQPVQANAAAGYPNQQTYPQAPQDQGTQQPQGAPVNPSQGQAPGGYADPNAQQTQPGQQMQLPYGGPQGGPAPAGQMPAGGPQGPAPQPGTSGSALDPARQQLLARITNQQPQQQQQPQQPQG